MLEAMVKDLTITQSVLNPFKNFRLKGDWTLTLRVQEKLFRFTFDKRLVSVDFTTVPFGYHPE